MRKSYLMIAAAVALFTACAEKDAFKDVDTQDVAIGFDGKYVNKVTRAEIVETWFQNTSNHFGVYGYKGDFQLFNKEDVSWNGSDWTHSTVRFWDKAATDYNFYAYAPYAATHTFTNKKFTFTSIPVIKDISTDNADIVIATPITAMGYGNCTQKTVAGHGEGHVEFDFNHILSKLAFKVKTSVNPNYAEIKVTKVELDFPEGTASWTQTAYDATPGTTAYSSYDAKDAVSIDAQTSEEVVDLTKFETPVFEGTTAVLTDQASEIVDATTATNKAKVFIVAPVATSGDGTEHVFGVKVTYNVQYKKKTGSNPDTYENDGDPEVGCIATGVIGGHATDATKQYKPTQNSSYIVTINVNPDQIEFCVDDVNSWATPDVVREGEVK